MTTLSTPRSATIVCHCLQITEAQIHESVDSGQIASVKDIMDCTGAGSGCTACHRRILAILREKSSQPSTCPSQT